MMKNMSNDYGPIEKDIQKLINAYDVVVKGIDDKAKISEDRAYGGIIRAGKGELVESMAAYLVELAWGLLDVHSNRLKINRQKIMVPLKSEYLKKIKSDNVRKFITDNIHKYYYPLSTDIHILIDNRFVIAIECKAYTENAMLKRILVDATLLKHMYPDLNFILFQLESQLGGDFSELPDLVFGSPSTHTLLSYFDINLHIITMLKGERKVDRPIHNPRYYKSLTKESLCKAIEVFQELLQEYR